MDGRLVKAKVLWGRPMIEAECLVRGLGPEGAEVILVGGARPPRHVYLWLTDQGVLHRARAAPSGPMTFRLTFVETRDAPRDP